MHSCLYEGLVTHARARPVVHQFQYRLFLAYLDLDELPGLLESGRFASSKKIACRSFLRNDHLFQTDRPLATEVRQIVAEHVGRYPTGPIRLLTQLRHFGYYFSPLNLFYVFDPAGKYLESIVAEVSNTPWKERHCYVLSDKNQTGENGDLTFTHRKRFHVSPFMGMDMSYNWLLTTPASSLEIQLSNVQGDDRIFHAGMALQRREINSRELRRLSIRYPWMTAQISIAIYYQALKLWWKRCPFYSHPKQQQPRIPNTEAMLPPNHTRAN